MALVEQDFRGNVLRSSANCIRPLCDHLRESEVNQLQIAVATYHNVLGLQISVHDVLALQILEN